MPLLSIRSIFNKVYDAANERLNVGLAAVDIEIGAVELKDGTADTRAKVAATGSVAEGDNAVAVQAPVLGATDGAAVVTDAAGTVQQYLRGLVKLVVAKITVNIQVGGVTPQLDDTDKIAASMHGKDAAAGDTPLVVRVVAASADVHEPAANTVAVVTYAGVAGEKHVITGVAWSYAGAAPTAGSLKVEDVSGTTVFIIGIAAEGAGVITFPKPKKGAAVNTAMIITLAAGGGGVTGKVSVLNHWSE